MKILMNGALLCGLALALSACGGGGSDDNGGGNQPAAAVQDGFGAGFQSAFDAGTNAEDSRPGGVAGAVDTTAAAAAVAAGDVTAVSFTTDPVALP